MNPLLRMLLGFANVPEQTVTDLQNDLPALARLDAIAHELEPDIKLALPHLVALAPIAQRVLPRVIEAWPDLQQVAPVADEILKLAQGKGN